MSKQDKLYKDAMETAAVSNETAVAEELLSYFVDIGNKECFAAMLYVCFDLLRPDVVAELVSMDYADGLWSTRLLTSTRIQSWRHGLNDFTFPYTLQSQRDQLNKASLPSKDDRSPAKVISNLFVPPAHRARKGTQGVEDKARRQRGAGRLPAHHGTRFRLQVNVDSGTHWRNDA
jgi:hypothetical protein